DDLLDSAGRQILLHRALGLGPIPTYTHLPLVRGPDGRRLAKRHGDTRTDHYRQRGVPRERILGLLPAWPGILTRTPRRPTTPAPAAAARSPPTPIPRWSAAPTAAASPNATATPASTTTASAASPASASSASSPPGPASSPAPPRAP